MGPRTQVLGLRLPDGTKSRQNLGTCTRRESCQKWLLSSNVEDMAAAVKRLNADIDGSVCKPQECQLERGEFLHPRRKLRRGIYGGQSHKNVRLIGACIRFRVTVWGLGLSFGFRVKALGLRVQVWRFEFGGCG